MKQTLSSFFGIFFAITAVFLYPTVCTARLNCTSKTKYLYSFWYANGKVYTCDSGYNGYWSWKDYSLEIKWCKNDFKATDTMYLGKTHRPGAAEGVKETCFLTFFDYNSSNNEEQFLDMDKSCTVSETGLKNYCETPGGNYVSGKWKGVPDKGIILLKNACTCPDNSTYKLDGLYRCKCNSGYKNENGTCVLEKSAEQVACENTKGKWANNACSCSGEYYTKDKKTCTHKEPNALCSAEDLAKITGAASGVYNNNLKCVLKTCKSGLEEVVKNGVRQGWCNKPQSQNDGETQGGTVGNWWTLLVESIK